LFQVIVNLLKGKPDATLKDGIYSARQVPLYQLYCDKDLTPYFSTFREAVDKVHKAAKLVSGKLAPSPEEIMVMRWNPQVRVFSFLPLPIE